MTSNIKTLLQELENRTVEVAVAADIRHTKSTVDRETIKSIAQGAENSLEPWFDGLMVIGNIAFAAGIGDKDNYLQPRDFERLGRLISEIGKTMEALYCLQLNAESILERMPKDQPKEEAA